MAHKTFAEYLDNKSKFSSKGKVEVNADYDGPTSSAPPKGEMPKDAGGVGQKGSMPPYQNGVNAKDPNKGKLTDGFSDKGNKSLEYTPGKLKDNGNFVKGDKEVAGVPGGKKVDTYPGGKANSWPPSGTKSNWPKTKTQEWIDQTKGLSLAEFTKMIQKATSDNLDKLDECACQNTSALDAIKHAVSLAKANESAMVSLIREIKRSKAFSRLVAELLQHDETYGVIARFMERDEKYARRLVRAMNEMVGPPAHKDDIEDDDEDPSKPPHPEDFHGSDDDDMGDDDMGMSGDDMGDDDMGMGGDDMGMGDDAGMDDPTMGPHGHGGDPDSDLAPGSKIMPHKKKKKHAHHHLMAALKDSPMGQDAGGMGAMGGGVGPV